MKAENNLSPGFQSDKYGADDMSALIIIPVLTTL